MINDFVKKCFEDTSKVWFPLCEHTFEHKSEFKDNK